ncbi:hypothetical protein PR048_002015 [Dryococelus australis]|uniref:Gag-like protein n=1 Tax=Dryococelus australis TaxID=614101 RepID=A0ABQ9IIY9_9NEOP|nr:hypothetical protein PR048_002015 [Dryococelus australis]
MGKAGDLLTGGKPPNTPPNSVQGVTKPGNESAQYALVCCKEISHFIPGSQSDLGMAKMSEEVLGLSYEERFCLTATPRGQLESKAASLEIPRPMRTEQLRLPTPSKGQNRGRAEGRVHDHLFNGFWRSETCTGSLGPAMKPHNESTVVINTIQSFMGDLPDVVGETFSPTVIRCLEHLHKLIGAQLHNILHLKGRVHAIEVIPQQERRTVGHSGLTTFAQILAGGGGTDAKPQSPPKVTWPAAPKRVVVVQPPDAETSVMVTKERVLNDLALEEASRKVQGIRPVARGALAVVTGDDEMMDSLERLVSTWLEILKVRELHMFDPCIVIYNVPRDASSPDKLVDAMFGSNLCFKFQSFGHFVRCKADKPTCGFCGVERHDFGDCPQR